MNYDPIVRGKLKWSDKILNEAIIQSALEYFLGTLISIKRHYDNFIALTCTELNVVYTRHFLTHDLQLNSTAYKLKQSMR